MPPPHPHAYHHRVLGNTRAGVPARVTLRRCVFVPADFYRCWLNYAGSVGILRCGCADCRCNLAYGAVTHRIVHGNYRTVCFAPGDRCEDLRRSPARDRASCWSILPATSTSLTRRRDATRHAPIFALALCGLFFCSVAGQHFRGAVALPAC